MGIGKFGEFATFILEEVTNDLLKELKTKKSEDHTEVKKKGFDPKAVIAKHKKVKVVGVLRIYAPTTPGKRSPKMRTRLIHPEKDLGLDIKEISREARDRHGL